MGHDKAPATPAVRALRQAGVAFTEHPYMYVEHGGTAAFATEAGVDEHAVVKTLIMEDDAKKPLVVLMHGDREVSTKELARILGVKSVRPCAPDAAERHSGYMVGGTSPFGLRKPMPVYVEASVLDLPEDLHQRRQARVHRRTRAERPRPPPRADPRPRRDPLNSGDEFSPDHRDRPAGELDAVAVEAQAETPPRAEAW